jgi:hypothetical protein
MMGGERIATEKPHDYTNRSEDEEVDHPHDDRRRHSRDRVREPHPRSLNRTESRRNESTSEYEGGAHRTETARQRFPTAPEQQTPQNQEGTPYAEAELAARFRGQSSWNSRCHSDVSSQAGCWTLSSKNGPSTR